MLIIIYMGTQQTPIHTRTLTHKQSLWDKILYPPPPHSRGDSRWKGGREGVVSWSRQRVRRRWMDGWSVGWSQGDGDSSEMMLRFGGTLLLRPDLPHAPSPCSGRFSSFSPHSKWCLWFSLRGACEKEILKTNANALPSDTTQSFNSGTPYLLRPLANPIKLNLYLTPVRWQKFPSPY